MELLFRNLLLAPEDEDAAGLFRLVLVHVIENGGAGQHTGEDAEQGQLAHKGVSNGLIDEGRERLIVLAHTHLRFTGTGVEAGMLNAIMGRRGQILRHQVHHACDTNAGQCRYGTYGNDAAILHALAEALEDFVIIQFTLIQVLHHQVVISGGSLLSQIIKSPVYLFLHVFRHRHFYTLLIGTFVGLLFQHVHNAAETLAVADGHQHRHYAAAVTVTQLLSYLVKAGVLTVHLVHNKHTANAALHGILKGLLSTDIKACYGADYDAGSLNNTEGAGGLTNKIKIAGNVNDVQHLVVPIDRSTSGADRALTLDFFRLKVRCRGSVFDFALTINNTGSEEHCFR